MVLRGDAVSYERGTPVTQVFPGAPAELFLLTEPVTAAPTEPLAQQPVVAVPIPLSPKARNPETETPKPKPGNRNSEPETRNMTSGTRPHRAARPAACDCGSPHLQPYNERADATMNVPTIHWRLFASPGRRPRHAPVHDARARDTYVICIRIHTHIFRYIHLYIYTHMYI